MALEFVKSQKGKDFLVEEGYTFRNERISMVKTIWKCTNYRKHKCMARCHTEKGNIKRTIGVHNHVPDTAEIEARKTLQKMKDRAITTQESTHQLLQPFHRHVLYI